MACSCGCTTTTTTTSGTCCSSCGCQIGTNQISWFSIYDPPNWLEEDNVPKTVQKTLTSTQILALNGTPIEIVPAPNVSNKYIDIIDAYAVLTFNTTGYTNAGANRLALKYDTATNHTFSVNGTFVAKTSTAYVRFFPNDAIDNFLLNKGVFATILNANPTLGNSTITIIVTYRTKILT